MDNLKGKLYFHSLKYILENDVMDEQTRGIFQTQRKGCKQQDSNECATVNDTEASGSGSHDCDDASNHYLTVEK